ncbi:MAG: hypothetical protein KC457_32820 [Myxococcales bacterium]|nr:hypothetical protein [Myxococcales bacterium]
MGWALVIYGGMVTLGWSARVLLPELANAEDAFIAATDSLLPAVLAGIMIAALLSAIMSTADSQLLVAASTISHDLLGLRGERDSSDPRTLRRSRATVLALSIGAVGVALLVDESIFSSVLFAWTAMGAAFGPLLLVTVLRRRPRAAWVLAAMGVGFAMSVIAHFISSPQGVLLERVAPFVVAFFLAWWGSRPRIAEN